MEVPPKGAAEAVGAAARTVAVEAAMETQAARAGGVAQPARAVAAATAAGSVVGAAAAAVKVGWQVGMVDATVGMAVGAGMAEGAVEAEAARAARAAAGRVAVAAAEVGPTVGSRRSSTASASGCMHGPWRAAREAAVQYNFPQVAAVRARARRRRSWKKHSRKGLEKAQPKSFLVETAKQGTVPTRTLLGSRRFLHRAEWTGAMFGFSFGKGKEESPEEEELRDLKLMFGDRPGAHGKSTSMSVAAAAKLSDASARVRMGCEARKEKEERARVRQKMLEKHRKRGISNKMETKAGQERARQLIEELRNQNQLSARQVREDEARWEVHRSDMFMDRKFALKERVLAHFTEHASLDAKLDAEEAAYDQWRREQAAEDRQALQEALTARRRQDESKRRAVAASVREQAVNARDATKRIERERAASGNAKREAARAWKESRRAEAERFQRKANAFRAQVLDGRAHARALQEDARAANNASFHRDRHADEVRAQLMAARQAALRKKAAARYRERFVEPEEESFWKNSPLIKWFPNLNGSPQSSQAA